MVEVAGIFQGMQMVKKQLDDFLSAQGVEEVPAEGREFDFGPAEAMNIRGLDGASLVSALRWEERG